MLGVVILRSPIFKSDANKYLAYAVIGLSFAMLSLAYEFTEDYPRDFLPFIIDIFSSGALFPVLILLFIVNQVDHPLRRSGKRWWWFLPHVSSVALSGLHAIADLITDSIIVKALFDAVELGVFLLILAFIPGVLLYAYSFLKYANSPREERWLTQLWLWVFAIMASWVSSIIFVLFSFIDLAWVFKTIALSASFLIHWITYVGIFRFKLSKDQEEIRALIGRWKSGSIKPALSIPSPLPLQSEEKQEPSFTEENVYFKKLETLCADERIYLDPTLDRAQVAEMLGISPGYVSQLVNSITGDNFSTYINRYRVEAVKAMIASAEFDNYSLLAIGLESGFSSKTTFHTAFKKLTGMTPNGCRKAHS